MFELRLFFAWLLGSILSPLLDDPSMSFTRTHLHFVNKIMNKIYGVDVFYFFFAHTPLNFALILHVNVNVHANYPFPVRVTTIGPIYADTPTH